MVPILSKCNPSKRKGLRYTLHSSTNFIQWKIKENQPVNFTTTKLRRQNQKEIEYPHSWKAVIIKQSYESQKRFLSLSVNLKIIPSHIKGCKYSVRHIYQNFSSGGEVNKLGKTEVLCLYLVWNKKTALFPPQKSSFAATFTVVISQWGSWDS